MRVYPFLLILILLSSCNVIGNRLPSEVDDKQSANSTILVPTPRDNNSCTITGLLYENAGSPQPVVGASLYLGEIIKNGQETPIMATMNRILSLRAITDLDGRFAFVDVPGNNYYSLIFDIVTESFMLYDPEGDGDLIFRCNGGAILDLGKLIYDNLP